MSWRLRRRTKGDPPMLVLSRRQGQRILFPSLGIAVSVLPGKGNAVRLGIEAPRDVGVLREELAGTVELNPAADPKDREANHDARTLLNALGLALLVAEKQLKAGLVADAQRTLLDARTTLDKLPPPADGRDHAHVDERKQPIKALVVEDNASEAALLSSYLRLSGFRVDTAHDGYEALNFLADHGRPDFLLLDMHLPRFDGPSTVGAIRQNPVYQGLTIFAVTGAAPGEFELPIGQTGVDAWFRKPLNPKSIVDAMSAAAMRN
jgi:carbon storage regulator CsrA